MDLIHSSEFTKVFIKDNYVNKHFLGDEADYRFEKELSFYKKYECENLMKLIDYNSKNFTLSFEYLRGEFPGFLDKLEAENLTKEDILRIKKALRNIQSLNTQKIIVHNDLAPHNIYLTENRVIIADWDSYFYTNDKDYKDYDINYLLKNIKQE